MSIARAARAAAAAALVALLAVAPVALLTPGRAYGAEGRWVWPLAGHPTVVHGFDPPAKRWLPGHRGVDLAAEPGTPVRAAGAGVIGYAGMLAGRGVVTVQHGSLRTTYEPVEASVHRGERVTAGEVIGHLQDTPGHCRPQTCLHWGLLRGDHYLNPLSLVQGRIRLLPVWGKAKPRGEASSATGEHRAQPAPTVSEDTGDNVAPAAAGAGIGGLAVAGAAGALGKRHRRGRSRRPG
jgi:murein DD-endopeptidase MepM/ murein hydrolase activator NlpD